MRSIIYKRIFGAYEISDIEEGAGCDVTVKFEEAFDGILVIGDSDFSVSHGIAKINGEKLTDGVKYPKLYTDGGKEMLESFTVKGGAIIRHNPDTDCIRRLQKEVSELSERVSELELSDIEIKNRITQRLEF